MPPHVAAGTFINIEVENSKKKYQGDCIANKQHYS
jgi:hypothetical protein